MPEGYGSPGPERAASVREQTEETAVSVDLSLGGGEASISTGIPFFDHLLEQLASHSNIGLSVIAESEIDVDAHHTVETTGIALGQALLKALGDKEGIRRFGDALVPMEEALAEVGLDISGHPFLVYNVGLASDAIGRFDTDLTEEFLGGLTRAAGINLHVRLISGRNPLHCVEAVFTALARALGDAVSYDPARRKTGSTAASS